MTTRQDPDRKGAAPRDATGLTYSEHIAPDSAGHLRVEGVRCGDLAEEYGTPLFVLSEAQIRSNYRRIRDAYRARYTEGAVTILYAVKANNNLAVRKILSQEGAGGDCFGIGEIYISLLGGADPEKLVLNGSSKSDAELDAAVTAGMQVHVETVDDVNRLEEVAARLDKKVRAKVRIKPRMPELADVHGVWSAARSVDESMQRYKWGARLEEAEEVVRSALASQHIDLHGFHCHQGRQTNTPEFFVSMMTAMVRFADEIRSRTGFVAKLFDVGGGYPTTRDPTGRGVAAEADPVEAFAEAMISALRAALTEFDYPAPDLELEPGRFIIEDAEVLLTRVGTIKREPGLMTWVNLDTSFNHLLETYTDATYHHIVPVDRVDQPVDDEPLEIVGPTCYEDVLGVDRWLPSLTRGDILAFLDVGAYGEVFATQFNGMPRPATLLVNGSAVHVIKERESVQDVFVHHIVPPHLLI